MSPDMSPKVHPNAECQVNTDTGPQPNTQLPVSHTLQHSTMPVNTLPPPYATSNQNLTENSPLTTNNDRPATSTPSAWINDVRTMVRTSEFKVVFWTLFGLLVVYLLIHILQ